jgi:hypothetical protein
MKFIFLVDKHKIKNISNSIQIVTSTNDSKFITSNPVVICVGMIADDSIILKDF